MTARFTPKIYAYHTDSKAWYSAKDFDTLEAAGNTTPRDIWSDGVTMWVARFTPTRCRIRRAHTAAQSCCGYRGLCRKPSDFDGLKAAGNDHAKAGPTV